MIDTSIYGLTPVCQVQPNHKPVLRQATKYWAEEDKKFTFQGVLQLGIGAFQLPAFGQALSHQLGRHQLAHDLTIVFVSSKPPATREEILLRSLHQQRFCWDEKPSWCDLEADCDLFSAQTEVFFGY